MNLSEVRQVGLPLINLVKLKKVPIFKQLLLEEQLLRRSTDNWCIINDGTDSPNIVMGLSGKPSELLELASVRRDKVPVIKRFTGGGTVIVDINTIFVTLICNRDDVPNVQPYPRSIMSWSGLLYDEVFKGISDFQLCENDYVFGNRKFGGNAQSIIRKRWIHHTSFLWDFEPNNMAYLKLPTRTPEYRSKLQLFGCGFSPLEKKARSHVEFICRMKDYISRPTFIGKTIEAIGSQFLVKPVDFDINNATKDGDFVHSTRLLLDQDLEQ